jgi:hypothetical protein
VEAAGVVEAFGAGVTELRPGERVAYVQALGAYVDRRVIAADRLLKLPDKADDRVAAASLVKGLTAHYLLRTTHAVGEGETILVHAAAGGVGLLLCQWAKQLGTRVLGTVGSEEKARRAAAHGCDLPIVYTHEDFRLAQHRGAPDRLDLLDRRAGDLQPVVRRELAPELGLGEIRLPMHEAHCRRSELLRHQHDVDRIVLIAVPQVGGDGDGTHQNQGLQHSKSPVQKVHRRILSGKS